MLRKFDLPWRRNVLQDPCYSGDAPMNALISLSDTQHCRSCERAAPAMAGGYHHQGPPAAPAGQSATEDRVEPDRAEDEQPQASPAPNDTADE